MPERVLISVKAFPNFSGTKSRCKLGFPIVHGDKQAQCVDKIRMLWFQVSFKASSAGIGVENDIRIAELVNKPEVRCAVPV
jgi:hypothetical protein